ncbi:hypothetical protein GMW39_23820 [Pectobacterium parmentieri]|uniref:hypothetical protein n=1 Tax=Pectobacterium parmentieri TaxID=1905730 RepID=UPI0013744EA7|nr:hypothetical protein [Pectobacterium parmentieri]QHQ18558.1 hypothetical protein GMW39_23820 [Pectobacterium parmentieri]QQA76812.1 hypothetical protein JBL47_04105 [Pectobacterium parmentieri]
MKLAGIYKLKIKEINKEKILAQHEIDHKIRANHRNKAWGLENEASDIAHALAFFGDVTKSEASSLVGKEEVLSLQLHGFNPWLNGLRIFLRS